MKEFNCFDVPSTFAGCADNGSGLGSSTGREASIFLDVATAQSSELLGFALEAPCEATVTVGVARALIVEAGRLDADDREYAKPLLAGSLRLTGTFRETWDEAVKLLKLEVATGLMFEVGEDAGFLSSSLLAELAPLSVSLAWGFAED